MKKHYTVIRDYIYKHLTEAGFPLIEFNEGSILSEKTIEKDFKISICLELSNNFLVDDINMDFLFLNESAILKSVKIYHSKQGANVSTFITNDITEKFKSYKKEMTKEQLRQVMIAILDIRINAKASVMIGTMFQNETLVSSANTFMAWLKNTEDEIKEDYADQLKDMSEPQVININIKNPLDSKENTEKIVDTIIKNINSAGASIEQAANAFDDVLENLILDGGLDKAHQVYSALTNIDWSHPESGAKQGCTFREAAGWIADVRCKDEGYMDFYCSAKEGVVSDEIKELLSAIGWKFKKL